MDESLWPARNVAEYAYCPRLFYYMEVEGIHVPSGRQRRPPPDPINAALSFAYSMLTHECTAVLRTARLEPSIAAFHVSRPGRRVRTDGRRHLITCRLGQFHGQLFVENLSHSEFHNGLASPAEKRPNFSLGIG